MTKTIRAIAINSLNRKITEITLSKDATDANTQCREVIGCNWIGFIQLPSMKSVAMVNEMGSYLEPETAGCFFIGNGHVLFGNAVIVGTRGYNMADFKYSLEWADAKIRFANELEKYVEFAKIKSQPAFTVSVVK